MAREFTDYDGPTGLYIATGKAIVPLGTAEGLGALAQSAMLLSLGDTPEAADYAAKMRKSLDLARALDQQSAHAAEPGEDFPWEELRDEGGPV